MYHRRSVAETHIVILLVCCSAVVDSERQDDRDIIVYRDTLVRRDFVAGIGW